MRWTSGFGASCRFGDHSRSFALLMTVPNDLPRDSRRTAVDLALKKSVPAAIQGWVDEGSSRANRPAGREGRIRGIAGPLASCDGLADGAVGKDEPTFG